MDTRSLIFAAAGELKKSAVYKTDLVAIRHILKTERSSTAVAVFHKGGGLRPHYHVEHDEIITFLTGKATFRIGDEITTVSANDVVVVPAGTVHATLEAEEECIVSAVFAPSFDLENEDRIFVDGQTSNRNLS